MKVSKKHENIEAIKKSIDVPAFIISGNNYRDIAAIVMMKI
jgi:hypothetical protein